MATDQTLDTVTADLADLTKLGQGLPWVKNCSNWNLGATHVALVLGGNAQVLLADKALDTVAVSLAVTVEVSKRSVTLVLARNAKVLQALEAVGAVAVNVAGLVEVGQGRVTGNLVGNTVAVVVAALGDLAVGVDLATRGLLGGRSHSKASKHGGD